MIILVATNQEFELARKHLRGYTIIQTGVGASNIIRTCADLTLYAGKQGITPNIINVGFAGSNSLPVGTVAKVSTSHRLIDHTVGFVDFHNGYRLCADSDGYPCYTSNDFVIENTADDPVLYDMELNYIVAFPFNVYGSIKIVSDNLCTDTYAKSIHTSTEETWRTVRKFVDEMNKKA